MTSDKIQEIIKARKSNINHKKNQIPYAVILIFIIIIIFFKIRLYNVNNSIIWIIAILTGIILRRSRFCFTAGFRDPVLSGSTSILRAIILGLIIATIGFGIIHYNYYVKLGEYNISELPGQIYPVGIHTAFGAIMFGIGMVISGGCASGTIMRIGEGFLLQIVVLVGFIIGTILGASNYSFWDNIFISKCNTIYLPKTLGYPITIVIQVIILIIFYILALFYDKKNNILL